MFAGAYTTFMLSTNIKNKAVSGCPTIYDLNITMVQMKDETSSAIVIYLTEYHGVDDLGWLNSIQALSEDSATLEHMTKHI